MRKFNFKKALKTLIKPYTDFKVFFGKTNTHLLLFVFLLMFIILNISVSPKQREINTKETNNISADLHRYKSLESVWSSHDSYNFIHVKKTIEDMKFAHKGSDIVYNQNLEKLVYQNSQMTTEKKEVILSDFNGLKCEYNYCYFN